VQTSPGSVLVFELDDAHAAVWPRLAAETGVELRRMSNLVAFREAEGAAGIVAATGDAARLDAIVRELQCAPIEIAAVASAADHRAAVALCRAGASDLFVLDREYASLREWITSRARAVAPHVACQTDAFRGIRGESDAIEAVRQHAARIAQQSHATVLITGEQGTGKAMLGRAIHDASPRAAAAFIDVDCAAVAEHRLESELFGREAGALADRGAEPGLIDAARGGTIVLRSVEHASPRVQAKLVALLSDRTIRREGGTTDHRVDVRVIATTHADLARCVRRGELRRDLYSRLNIVAINVPPLRARPADVLPIARHYLGVLSAKHGLHGARLTPSAERLIRSHTWPGNIRELRDAIERAVLFASEPDVGASALRSITDHHSLSDDARLERLNAIIRRTVLETVDVCGGNKSDAARRLGISRTRLQRLLRPDPRNRSSEHLAERADD